MEIRIETLTLCLTLIATVGGLVLPSVDMVFGLFFEYFELIVSTLSFIGFAGIVSDSDIDVLRQRIKGRYSGAYRLKAEKSSNCPVCYQEMQGNEVLNVLKQNQKGTQWVHLGCSENKVPAVQRRSKGTEANKLIVYTHAIEGLWDYVKPYYLSLDDSTSNGLNYVHHPDTNSSSWAKLPRSYLLHYHPKGNPTPLPKVPKKQPEPKIPSTPNPAPSETSEVSAQGNVIFDLIKQPLNNWASQFTGSLQGELRSEFDNMMQTVQDIAAAAPLRLTALKDDTVIFEEKVHGRFARLLRNCRTTVANKRMSSLLVGPAGSGKTYGAEQVFRALLKIPKEAGGIHSASDIVIVSCNEEMMPTEITGSTIPNISDGIPIYTMSKIVETYINGGILIFDEFDRLATGTAVALNAALAGNKWPLPDGSVAKRHEDAIFICTANTFGHGSNRTYNAANKLDGATLDRFAGGIIEWGYDEDLEKSFCPNAELRNLFLDTRNKMNNANIQRIISPRHLQTAYTMTQVHGIPVRQAFLEGLADWNVNDLKMIGLDPNEVTEAAEYQEVFDLGGAV